jgi:para-nitrobenzyl esterase
MWNSATLADIEQLGELFARHHGIEPLDPRALTKLRALSPEAVAGDLNLLSMTSHRPFTFAGPFVDGKAVVDPVRSPSSSIPVMVGATSDDFGGSTGYMVSGARRFASALAARGVPVYQYRFSYVAEHLAGDAGQADGAKHASDIPFFFNTQRIKYGELTTAADDRIGKLISDYLVAFVKTGDPNGDRRPAWPRWKTDGALMEFTSSGGIAKKDPLGRAIDTSSLSQNPDFFAPFRGGQ